MTGFLAHIRFAALALAVVFLIGVAAPAIAQQPTTVNPTASSVKEDQLLNALQGSGNVSGRVTIPDKKEGVLIQPGGRDWQAFHQITLKWIGAISILGMLLLLVGFYLFRGMVRIERGRSGRTIVRFNAAERFVHWMTATCFIILAISGLNITFGKSLLLPLMSPGAFTTWSQALKYAHNYLSFPFTFGVILMFLMWIGGNIPSKADVEWVKRGGGIIGDDHPPAPRFNAGQKMIYWIVVIGGSAVAITGYHPDVPVLWNGHRRDAACADHPRHRGAAVRRRHARAHLYRHHRHGRRLRGHGNGRSRRQLGERAPQPVARAGNERRPLARRHAQGHARRIGLKLSKPEAPGGNTGRFAFDPLAARSVPDPERRSRKVGVPFRSLANSFSG